MRIVALIVVLTLAPSIPATSSAAESGPLADQKAVLITGASTGLGRAMAERLAEDGYFVYAGARKLADLNALNAIENISAIRIDVTVQEEIDAAVATVQAAGGDLFALVNNAGVLITGPSAETSIDDVKWLFDVNVYGVMRMTSAFAPLLIENKGRVINIGSIAGSVGFGYLGAYSMTKHAIEAYTEALHTEMAPLGVGVSVIKPGDYASNIWNADAATTNSRLDDMENDGSPYAAGYREWLSVNVEQGDPDDVADILLQALSDQPMAKRYLIVPNETEMSWVMSNMLDRLADLNRNNEHAWPAEKIASDITTTISRKTAESNQSHR